jgi:tetratricopeptide (TPR) repeat protein
MDATRRSSVFEDPLREARLAVFGGRFQQGWNALRTLPAEVRGSPEGLLLAAMATWRLGEFERSRTAALQARDGFRSRGDSDGEMRAENVAAAGAFALGDLAEAERGFNRALSLADDLADDLMIARCANNLGNVAYYLARMETALSFYRLAIANFEKLAFWTGLAEGWLNSAIVLHDRGDFDASREAGERAIAAAERSGDGRILGQALAARSETDIALGDLALAKVLAERALTLAQTHDHVVGEADARRVLAVLARHRAEPTVALQLATQALEIAKQVRDPWRTAEILEEIGTIHATIGRTGDAIAAYDAAAHAFRELGAEVRAAAMRERSAGLPG